jgi:sulfur relay (sulfurtransferase) complex TusBCD TusD component (DsrE family)
LNHPPYGTERSYNALRLAGALSKREAQQVKMFLIGDAASCAKAGQKVLRTGPRGPTRRWHFSEDADAWRSGA